MARADGADRLPSGLCGRRVTARGERVESFAVEGSLGELGEAVAAGEDCGNQVGLGHVARTLVGEAVCIIGLHRRPPCRAPAAVLLALLWVDDQIECRCDDAKRPIGLAGQLVAASGSVTEGARRVGHAIGLRTSDKARGPVTAAHMKDQGQLLVRPCQRSRPGRTTHRQREPARACTRARHRGIDTDRRSTGRCERTRFASRAQTPLPLMETQRQALSDVADRARWTSDRLTTDQRVAMSDLVRSCQAPTSLAGLKSTRQIELDRGLATGTAIERDAARASSRSREVHRACGRAIAADLGREM